MDDRMLPPAFVCLKLTTQAQGIALNADLLQPSAESEPTTLEQLCRCARRAGLRARVCATDPERLRQMPLPLVTCLDDDWAVVAQVNASHVTVYLPRNDQVERVAYETFIKRWSGEVLLVANRTWQPGRAISWMGAALKPYTAIWVQVVIAALLIQLLALLSPLYFQLVVDKVLVHHGMSTLNVLAVAMVLTALAEVVLSTLRELLFSHTCTRVDLKLGADLFRHLMAIPLAYLQRRPVGEVMAHVRELEPVRQFLTGTSLTAVLDLVFSVIFFAVMLRYSPGLTAIVAVSVPVYFAIALAAGPLLRRSLRERFAAGAASQAILVESIAGAETVKATVAHSTRQLEWEKRLAESSHAGYRSRVISAVAGQGAQLVNKLITAAVLWAGAREVMQGTLTVGQLVAFNMLAARVAAPLLRLSQVWQEYQQAALGAQHLERLLSIPEEAGAGLFTPRAPARGAIRFEGASFTYPAAGKAVLRDLTFEVAAGEVVAIVGASGCGKSTVVRLLQRLFLPDSGRVLIDGTDLRRVDPQWLRTQIAAVGQDAVLFSGSVRDNIASFRPGVPIERVMNAARQAAADDFILDLPDGYATLLDEGGGNLSGGQRQRLALARALATDARILVLDEATSALDGDAEAHVIANLRRMAAGRTLVLLTHRPALLALADRILVIDEGRVVEQGTLPDLEVHGRHFIRLFTPRHRTRAA